MRSSPSLGISISGQLDSNTETVDNLNSDQSIADLELLFNHFKKSILYPFKIRNVISANLDCATMDLIIKNYDSLRVVEKLGFLMALMPRKSLADNMQSNIDELVGIALNDSCEFVSRLARRISTIPTTNAIDYGVMDPEFKLLNVEYKSTLIPHEAKYLSLKSLESMVGNFNDSHKSCIKFKRNVIEDEKTRLENYGITNTVGSNVSVARPSIVRRTSSLFHDMDVPARPVVRENKPNTNLFRPNKTKFLDHEQAQRIAESAQREQELLKAEKDRIKEEKRLLKEQLEEERRLKKEEKEARKRKVEQNVKSLGNLDQNAQQRKKPKIINGIDVDSVLKDAALLSVDDRIIIEAFFEGNYGILKLIRKRGQGC